MIFKVCGEFGLAGWLPNKLSPTFNHASNGYIKKNKKQIEKDQMEFLKYKHSYVIIKGSDGSLAVKKRKVTKSIRGAFFEHSR